MALKDVSKTLGQRNQEYFDSAAKDAYKEKWILDLVEQISQYLKDNVDWIVPNDSKQVRILDYACGGGIVSKSLASAAHELRGIDVSGGMVDAYNKSAKDLGLSPQQMCAIRGDLTSDALEEQDLFNFNVVGMSMALHHVESPEDMIVKLTQRLAPGGTLLIIDWVTHGDSQASGSHSHPAAHTVTRHGFSEKAMAEMYAAAGLSGFDFRLHAERSTIPGGGTQQLFFALGRLG